MRKISLDMFIYVFLFHDNVILTIRIFLLAVIFSRYQNNLFMYAILLVHLCVFLFYITRLTSCRLLLAINLILVFLHLQESVNSSEDLSAKTKSVIELKKLQLLPLQRRVRRLVVVGDPPISVILLLI